MGSCFGDGSRMLTSSYNVEMTIVQGRGLAAKDRHLLTRQRTTSDPYVEAFLGMDRRLGKTKVCPKTLDPVFDATFTLSVPNKGTQEVPADTCSFLQTNRTDENAASPEEMIQACGMILLKLYDHDQLTDDDLMGTLVIPIPTTAGTHGPQWYRVDNLFVPNAVGQLEVTLTVSPVFMPAAKTGGILPSPDTVVKWMRGLLGKQPEPVNEHNVVLESSSSSGHETRKSYLLSLLKAFA